MCGLHANETVSSTPSGFGTRTAGGRGTRGTTVPGRSAHVAPIYDAKRKRRGPVPLRTSSAACKEPMTHEAYRHTTGVSDTRDITIVWHECVSEQSHVHHWSAKCVHTDAWLSIEDESGRESNRIWFVSLGALWSWLMLATEGSGKTRGRWWCAGVGGR